MLYRILADRRNFFMMSFSHAFMMDSFKRGKTIANDPSPVLYADDWVAPDVKFVDGYPENKQEKAMCDILYDMGHLFLTEYASEVLKTYLREGELLPVTYDNKNGFIFNPLKILEANTAMSLRDNNGDISSLAFDGEAPVFKTEFDRYSGVYCNSEFKNAIEKAGLKGAVFSADLSATFITDNKEGSH